MRIHQVFEHYRRRDGNRVGDFERCPFCGTALQMSEIGLAPRPACPNCGFVQYRNPAPTVSVLVVDQDRILLGKRGGEPGRGTWALPSGYVEYDDDFLTTAVQEVKEETGLDVELCRLINVVSSFISPRFHFLGIYFAARVVGGEIEAGDDLREVAWFPLQGPLPEMGFEEDVAAIEMYAQGFEGLPVDAAYAGGDDENLAHTRCPRPS